MVFEREAREYLFSLHLLRVLSRITYITNTFTLVTFSQLYHSNVTKLNSRFALEHRYNLLEVEGDKSVSELDLYPRFRVKILYSSSEKNVVLSVSEKLSKSLTVMTHEDKAEEDEEDGFLDIEQDVVPIIVAPSSKSDDDEEEEERRTRHC